MSTSKVFQQFKNEEIKTFSKVVNKFDFDEIANRLLQGNCKGNFVIFDDVLTKEKRYAFLCFALPHLVYKTNTFDKNNMSELRLANVIECLFNLPQTSFEAKTRVGYDKEAKAAIYEFKTYLGMKELLSLWNKSTKVKTAKKATEKVA